MQARRRQQEPQMRRRVTLQLRLGARVMEYSSEILEIKPDYVKAVSPISETGTPLPLEAGRPISIYEETEGGPTTTYNTKVREQAMDDITGEYVVIMEHPNPPMRVRRYVRQTVPSSLTLTTSVQPPRVYEDARCVNLSAGGILIRVELESPQELNLGDRVVLNFQLPISRKTSLSGKTEIQYSPELELYGTVIRKYRREMEAITYDFIGIEFDPENFLRGEGEERRSYIQRSVLYHQILERETQISEREA